MEAEHVLTRAAFRDTFRMVFACSHGKYQLLCRVNLCSLKVTRQCWINRPYTSGVIFPTRVTIGITKKQTKSITRTRYFIQQRDDGRATTSPRGPSRRQTVTSPPLRAPVRQTAGIGEKPNTRATLAVSPSQGSANQEAVTRLLYHLCLFTVHQRKVAHSRYTHFGQVRSEQSAPTQATSPFGRR